MFGYVCVIFFSVMKSGVDFDSKNFMYFLGMREQCDMYILKIKV